MNKNNIKHDIENIDKNTFLFEMFCEELPYSVQVHVENEWSKKANEILKAALQIEPLQTTLNDVSHAKENSSTKKNNTETLDIKTFSTPRRVAIQIENIPLIYNTPVEYRKGPKINANRSSVDAFISKYSSKYCSKNDEFWFYQKNSEQEKIQKVLLELCNQFAFFTTGQKMMRWSNKKSTWFRPVHSVICMLNEEIIPFQYEDISSSNFTYGHRFLKHSINTNSTHAKSSYENSDIKYTEANSKGKDSIQENKIFLKSAKDYENILEQNKVIPCFSKRKEKNLKQIREISQTNSVSIKFDSLLDKITGLVEYPTVLTGCFDKSFLSLPFEVIETTLQNHQNAFAMYKNKELINSFLFVTNALTNEYQLIISGNEKVVAARLSDANFFWNIDKNTPRNEYENRIQNKVYYDNLGSLKDKVDRMLKIAETNAVQNIINETHEIKDTAGENKKNHTNQENNTKLKKLCTAIEYSKYDLCSNLVREFPELQGFIGSHYYQYTYSKNDISRDINSNNSVGNINNTHNKHNITNLFSEEVKIAIQNSYNLHLENENNITKALAFIDNLDKIVCFFSINIFPTSSGDPFALRRSGNIIASILSNSHVTLNNLKNLISDICENSIKTSHSFVNHSAYVKVIEFIFERMEKLAIIKYSTKISFSEIEQIISLTTQNTESNASNKNNVKSYITTSFLFSILDTISSIHSKTSSTCKENSIMEKISELSKRLAGLSEQMLSILLKKSNSEIEAKKADKTNAQIDKEKEAQSENSKSNIQQAKIAKNDFEYRQQYIQFIKKLLQKFQKVKKCAQQNMEQTITKHALQNTSQSTKQDIINAILDITQSKNQTEYLFKYQNFILNYHDKVLKFLKKEDIITNNLQKYDVNALNLLNNILNSTDSVNSLNSQSIEYRGKYTDVNTKTTSEINLETEEKIFIIVVTNELYRMKAEFMLLLFTMTRKNDGNSITKET